MSKAKTTDISKPPPKTLRFLAKTGKTIAVELTEGQLERVSGGNRPIIVVC